LLPKVPLLTKLSQKIILVLSSLLSQTRRVSNCEFNFPSPLHAALAHSTFRVINEELWLVCAVLGRYTKLNFLGIPHTMDMLGKSKHK
jgi:hypothetical protein